MLDNERRNEQRLGVGRWYLLHQVWHRWDELEDAISRAEEGKETDEDLLLIAYQQDYIYYTEWEDESEYQYEEVYGELIEIQWI